MATLSLSTKLVAGCMVMLVFSLVLSTSLITMFGTYYARADRDVALLTIYKRVLVAAVAITVDRGPVAALFDSEPNGNEAASAELAQDRAEGDADIDAILRPSLRAVNLAEDADLVTAVDKARKALVLGRQEIDSIVALPKSQRTADRMYQGIRDMFIAVDLIRPIAVQTISKISAEDQSLAGTAIIAQMLADVRDYAGRFGFEIVPFVTARSPLPESVVFEIARTRERILSTWQLVSRQGGLYPRDRELEALRLQVNARFFGQGLQTIDRAVATGRLTGDFGITNRELTDRFIPTLQPMEQLRNGFLEAALLQLQNERTQAMVWLIVVSILAVIIVAATLALIIAARQFVLRPLMLASDHIVALSNGEALEELESPTNSREMLRLFDALEGLRIILGEREQYTERLKVLSETDGLTGLINRRLLDRIGLGDSEFDGLPRDVSVIMMDLDRFKGVNDTYGHLAGDLVLKHAAGVVQRVCRKNDLAARYGGEEIAVIIFEQDDWVAMHVAERIRTEIEAEPVVLPDGRRVSVTASFGVAHGKRGGSQWLAMVKAADAALYEAKASGRNRVARASAKPARGVKGVA